MDIKAYRDLLTTKATTTLVLYNSPTLWLPQDVLVF